MRSILSRLQNCPVVSVYIQSFHFLTLLSSIFALPYFCSSFPNTLLYPRFLLLTQLSISQRKQKLLRKTIKLPHTDPAVCICAVYMAFSSICGGTVSAHGQGHLFHLVIHSHLLPPTQEHCSSNSSPSFLCLQFSPSLSPLGFPGGTNGKRTLLQCRRPKRCGFDPWVRKIPWRKAWQLTPGFLPGESHGQRSLVGYSPQDHKESDTTEVTQQQQHM